MILCIGGCQNFSVGFLCIIKNVASALAVSKQGILQFAQKWLVAFDSVRHERINECACYLLH